MRCVQCRFLSALIRCWCATGTSSAMVRWCSRRTPPMPTVNKCIQPTTVAWQRRPSGRSSVLPSPSNQVSYANHQIWLRIHLLLVWLSCLGVFKGYLLLDNFEGILNLSERREDVRRNGRWSNRFHFKATKSMKTSKNLARDPLKCYLKVNWLGKFKGIFNLSERWENVIRNNGRYITD